MPFCKLASARGGSPFEKLTTAVALGIAFPQSSVTCSSMLVGQETGDAKLLPKLRNIPSNCVGEHDVVAVPCVDDASTLGPAPVTRNNRLTTCNGLLSSNPNVSAPR